VLGVHSIIGMATMAKKRANISEITRWRVRAEGWACNPDKKTSSWFCFEEEFDNGKDAFNLALRIVGSNDDIVEDAILEDALVEVDCLASRKWRQHCALRSVGNA
jgi:hypothetical protein